MLSIEIRRDGDCTVCALHGEVDAWSVSPFRSKLSELVGEELIVLDLCDTPFMDSAGLGALIGGIRRARDAGGDLAVACSRPPLRRLLHTTGLDRLVRIEDSVDDAIAALVDARSLAR